MRPRHIEAVPVDRQAWDALFGGPQGPFADDSWERLEMEKAIQLKRAGRYSESIQLYKKVIDRIPQCDPAYKQMAKVQIAAGLFEDAVRSTLMKIDLGIYFTKQSNPRAALQMRSMALENIRGPKFSPAVHIGSRLIASGEVFEMCTTDDVSADVALLAYAEDDVYYYLGHCLVRMFPMAFTDYQIPETLLLNFENAVAGKYSGADARDSIFAHVFYVTGFMLARQNISWTLDSIDPDVLTQRYNRAINFLGLARASISSNLNASKKKSFWRSIFG